MYWLDPEENRLLCCHIYGSYYFCDKVRFAKRRAVLTSFAQDEAIRKSALGLNLRALTVSSGGDWTSTSFMGFSLVPRPREFVVLEVDPNVPKLEVAPNVLFAVANILRIRLCWLLRYNFVHKMRSLFDCLPPEFSGLSVYLHDVVTFATRNPLIALWASSRSLTSRRLIDCVISQKNVCVSA